VLLLAGLASLAGLTCASLLVSPNPGVAVLGPLGVLCPSMLGLYVFGTAAPPAVALQAAESLGVAGLGVSMQARVLVVAPRRTDIASAGFSSPYNVGIAAGPVIGGFILSGPGLRSAALAGGLLAGAALTVVLCESFCWAVRLRRSRLPGK
jgi:predicted MFS family arabinose efflux permease